MAKIINIYGAPCAGKSTIAAGLFYEMKRKGYKVELSTEWIKNKVYEQTPYPFRDQIYTFAKQRKQIRQLMGMVDWIITDSPLLLSLIYGGHESQEFKKLVIADYGSYDNCDFLVERKHEYQSYGRMQDEKQSREIHDRIVGVLQAFSKYTVVNSNNAVEEILKVVENDASIG